MYSIYLYKPKEYLVMNVFLLIILCCGIHVVAAFTDIEMQQLRDILHYEIHASEQRLEQKINASEQRLEQKINASEQRLEQKINASEQRLEQKIHYEIYASEQRLEQKNPL